MSSRNTESNGPFNHHNLEYCWKCGKDFDEEAEHIERISQSSFIRCSQPGCQAATDLELCMIRAIDRVADQLYYNGSN